MPAAIKWDAPYNSRGNVLTTELNSLASGSRSAPGPSAGIANQTNLDQYARVEFTITFGTAPDAGGFVNLHVVQALDGTNYEDGNSSTDPGSHTIVASIPVKPSTAAQRLVSRQFLIGPGPTKFILANRTSQAFPASGNVVELFTFNDEIQSA